MSQPIKPWIQTYGGGAFDLDVPKVEQVDYHDLAHHLACINRYTGAAYRPYSVAEHSVRVALLLEKTGGATRGRELARWGLLHDAAEAYTNDMSAPMKHLPENAGYRVVEKRVEAVVFARFGLTGPVPPEVKHADNVLLITEKRDLLGPSPRDWGEWPEPLPEAIEPMSWHVAECAFLEAFHLYFPEVTHERRDPA